MNSETVKIFKTKEQVERLLREIPELRDNDERLVSNFWYRQLKHNGKDPHSLSCMEFLEIYKQNEILTGADIIVRARAKAQQKNPELRGEKYEERNNNGVEVTMEINSK